MERGRETKNDGVKEEQRERKETGGKGRVKRGREIKNRREGIEREVGEKERKTGGREERKRR
jgi:hypothetical protein